MIHDKLEAFVRQQNILDTEDDILNPEKELQEWIHYLNLLYTQITSFMSTYISEKMATISYDEITLTEDFSGSYSIRRMFLKIGRSTITFTPLGTMFIGSKGRVDVQGPSGGARLMLMNKKVTNARQLFTIRSSRLGEPPPALPKVQDIEWAWKIMPSPPQMDFIDLEKDSFSDMILTVAKY